MRGVSVRACILTVLALCMLIPGITLAQTGKISGTVFDTNGEPVIGANVLVEGTSRGASTDLDGYFVILAVQPGTYSVTASALGYTAITITGVQISMDRTSTLEFQLPDDAVKLEDVTVVWEKPVVELGVSSKVERIDPEALKRMPSDDVSSALLATPGFKLDDEGKIHIRGGRENEARFLIDGLDTRDPITGESLPLNLSSINFSEIQILTGGMSAEYGQAMSGFVTISTPEGKTDSYNGTIYYETDQLFDDFSEDEDKVNAAFGGPVPFTKTLFGRPLTFYVTLNGSMTNTHNYLGGEYDAEDYTGVGLKLPRRQSNDWASSLKFAYDLGGGKKLSLYMDRRVLAWDLFGRGTADADGNYGWQYKYNLDNLPQARDERSSYTLDFVNQASDKTVLKFSLGYRSIKAEVSPRGKKPGDFTLFDEVEEGNFNEENGRDALRGSDISGNGRWDQDADGNGVVHDGTDELANDSDSNNFLDGYFDHDGNRIYEGDNEGYEDLNLNGRWDRGEDWVDLNGNGIYDYAEPWTDRADPVTGQNNTGVWDPWDPYEDLNGNGKWDPAEPQLAEQDVNNNGRWDGERYQDANGDGTFNRWESFTDLNGNGIWDEGEPFTDLNGNGKQDDGEGYDDVNLNGIMDRRELVTPFGQDQDEPFLDGDLWKDTGEPFVDEPDPISGNYNGVWDEGEKFWDLPTSNSVVDGFRTALGAGGSLNVPTLNGVYDGPDTNFDEFELFTYFTGDVRMPVGYNWDLEAHGADWVYGDYLAYNPSKSTWTNRTIHDEQTPRFDPPNRIYDSGEERYVDYNGDGSWNRQDFFLNPGQWDNRATWTERDTKEYSFKFKWQSQIHRFHELKAGTEVKYYVMSQQLIQFPDQPYTGLVDPGEDEPWRDRGAVRDFWEYKPWEGAVYFEDKMEFEGLIVQAGMRVDFVIHDENVVDEQRRRLAEGELGAVDAVRSRQQFAPRLGISHPITERSKLYFNYGHFYQRPDFLSFYKATTNNVGTGYIGNPNLKYQKTVTYEIGIHNQLTDDISVQIAGYYRDVYDMISTMPIREQGVTFYRAVNLDYGRTRGFEMKLDKKFANHYQVNINYDFSYAYGKSNGALDDLNRPTNVPVNYDEHPLNWDETHRVTVNAAISYSKKDYPVLFGIRLPDYWLLSLQWQFGSGRPYTPAYEEYTKGIAPTLILANSARQPWTETTSLRFEKYFDVGSVRWIAGFRVDNLFDKKNVNTVYGQTGTPNIAVHPLNPNYNPTINRADLDANPRYYGAGRQIMLKVGLEF